jgi:hypothetical protein
MKRAVMAMMVVGALILAACSEDDPAREVTQGEELFAVGFDAPGTWEEGAYPADAPTSILTIADGRYEIEHRAEGSSSFTWGAGGEDYQNVIVEVNAEQLSDENDNLYGVACRLAENSDGSQNGYALLISGDGHYGIATIRNDTLNFLLDWHQSDAIHQGQAANTIRAVCVDDYLAIYANGTFLGDVTDSTYLRPGQVGLVAGVTRDSAVRIAFDDLTGYDGALE